MAIIYKNPNLPDYFVARDDVRLGQVDSTITEDYEAAKVIAFPNLKLDIDFEFWATLPTDTYPGLKKLTSLAFAPGAGDDSLLERNIKAAAVPEALEKAVRGQIRAIYDQLIPTYEAIFGDYSFRRRQAAWRLNSTYNENMHIDLYLEEYVDHFARMFLNLDVQPRIWQTSWTIDDMMERFGDLVDRKILETGTRAQIWIELNKVVFGASSKEWWDNQPRHVTYFEPGDVWAVDSRQVAHQIFYGRRAVSVDFFVDTASMKNPRRQYLNIVEDFRGQKLQAAE